jgi:hypothetical protein
VGWPLWLQTVEGANAGSWASTCNWTARPVDAEAAVAAVVTGSLLELANVKLNCKYLISSIWPRLKQELVEKYIKLGPVLFHIIQCLLIISILHSFISNEVHHNLNYILWFFICHVMWFYTPWPPSPEPCCYWTAPASNFLIGQAFSLPPGWAILVLKMSA